MVRCYVKGLWLNELSKCRINVPLEMRTPKTCMPAGVLLYTLFIFSAGLWLSVLSSSASPAPFTASSSHWTSQIKSSRQQFASNFHKEHNSRHESRYHSMNSQPINEYASDKIDHLNNECHEDTPIEISEKELENKRKNEKIKFINDVSKRTEMLNAKVSNLIPEFTEATSYVKSYETVERISKDLMKNTVKGDTAIGNKGTILPVIACLAGYDEQIFNIMNEIKHNSKGKEVIVHFYYFSSCKFHFMGSVMVDLRTIQEILKKYPHYFCLDHKYVEKYKENDCWCVEKLIMIPSMIKGYNQKESQNTNSINTMIKPYNFYTSHKEFNVNTEKGTSMLSDGIFSTIASPKVNFLDVPKSRGNINYFYEKTNNKEFSNSNDHVEKVPLNSDLTSCYIDQKNDGSFTMFGNHIPAMDYKIPRLYVKSHLYDSVYPNYDPCTRDKTTPSTEISGVYYWNIAEFNKLKKHINNFTPPNLASTSNEQNLKRKPSYFIVDATRLGQNQDIDVNVPSTNIRTSSSMSSFENQLPTDSTYILRPHHQKSYNLNQFWADTSNYYKTYDSSSYTSIPGVNPFMTKLRQTENINPSQFVKVPNKPTQTRDFIISNNKVIPSARNCITEYTNIVDTAPFPGSWILANTGQSSFTKTNEIPNHFDMALPKYAFAKSAANYYCLYPSYVPNKSTPAYSNQYSNRPVSYSSVAPNDLENQIAGITPTCYKNWFDARRSKPAWVSYYNTDYSNMNSIAHPNQITQNTKPFGLTWPDKYMPNDNRNAGYSVDENNKSNLSKPFNIAYSNPTSEHYDSKVKPTAQSSSIYTEIPNINAKDAAYAQSNILVKKLTNAYPLNAALVDTVLPLDKRNKDNSVSEGNQIKNATSLYLDNCNPHIFKLNPEHFNDNQIAFTYAKSYAIPTQKVKNVEPFDATRYNSLLSMENPNTPYSLNIIDKKFLTKPFNGASKDSLVSNYNSNHGTTVQRLDQTNNDGLYVYSFLPVKVENQMENFPLTYANLNYYDNWNKVMSINNALGLHNFAPNYYEHRPVANKKPVDQFHGFDILGSNTNSKANSYAKPFNTSYVDNFLQNFNTNAGYAVKITNKNNLAKPFNIGYKNTFATKYNPIMGTSVISINQKNIAKTFDKPRFNINYFDDSFVTKIMPANVENQVDNSASVCLTQTQKNPIKQISIGAKPIVENPFDISYVNNNFVRNGDVNKGYALNRMNHNNYVAKPFYVDYEDKLAKSYNPNNNMLNFYYNLFSKQMSNGNSFNHEKPFETSYVNRLLSNDDKTVGYAMIKENNVTKPFDVVYKNKVLVINDFPNIQSPLGKDQQNIAKSIFKPYHVKENQNNINGIATGNTFYQISNISPINTAQWYNKQTKKPNNRVTYNIKDLKTEEAANNAKPFEISYTDSYIIPNYKTGLNYSGQANNNQLKSIPSVYLNNFYAKSFDKSDFCPFIEKYGFAYENLPIQSENLINNVISNPNYYSKLYNYDSKNYPVASTSYQKPVFYNSNTNYDFSASAYSTPETNNNFNTVAKNVSKSYTHTDNTCEVLMEDDNIQKSLLKSEVSYFNTVIPSFEDNALPKYFKALHNKFNNLGYVSNYDSPKDALQTKKNYKFIDKKNILHKFYTLEANGYPNVSLPIRYEEQFYDLKKPNNIKFVQNYLKYNNIPPIISVPNPTGFRTSYSNGYLTRYSPNPTSFSTRIPTARVGSNYFNGYRTDYPAVSSTNFLTAGDATIKTTGYLTTHPTRFSTTRDIVDFSSGYSTTSSIARDASSYHTVFPVRNPTAIYYPTCSPAAREIASCVNPTSYLTNDASPTCTASGDPINYHTSLIHRNIIPCRSSSYYPTSYHTSYLTVYPAGYPITSQSSHERLSYSTDYHPIESTSFPSSDVSPTIAFTSDVTSTRTRTNDATRYSTNYGIKYPTKFFTAIDVISDSKENLRSNSTGYPTTDYSPTITPNVVSTSSPTSPTIHQNKILTKSYTTYSNGTLTSYPTIYPTNYPVSSLTSRDLTCYPFSDPTSYSASDVNLMKPNIIIPVCDFKLKNVYKQTKNPYFDIFIPKYNIPANNLLSNYQQKPVVFKNINYVSENNNVYNYNKNHYLSLRPGTKNNVDNNIDLIFPTYKYNKPLLQPISGEVAGKLPESIDITHCVPVYNLSVSEKNSNKNFPKSGNNLKEILQSHYNPYLNEFSTNATIKINQNNDNILLAESYLDRASQINNFDQTNTIEKKIFSSNANPNSIYPGNLSQIKPLKSHNAYSKLLPFHQVKQIHTTKSSNNPNLNRFGSYINTQIVEPVSFNQNNIFKSFNFPTDPNDSETAKENIPVGKISTFKPIYASYLNKAASNVKSQISQPIFINKKNIFKPYDLPYTDTFYPNVNCWGLQAPLPSALFNKMYFNTPFIGTKSNYPGSNIISKKTEPVNLYKNCDTRPFDAFYQNTFIHNKIKSEPNSKSYNKPMAYLNTNAKPIDISYQNTFVPSNRKLVNDAVQSYLQYNDRLQVGSPPLPFTKGLNNDFSNWRSRYRYLPVTNKKNNKLYYNSQHENTKNIPEYTTLINDLKENYPQYDLKQICNKYPENSELKYLNARQNVSQNNIFLKSNENQISQTEFSSIFNVNNIYSKGTLPSLQSYGEYSTPNYDLAFNNINKSKKPCVLQYFNDSNYIEPTNNKIIISLDDNFDLNNLVHPELNNKYFKGELSMEDLKLKPSQTISERYFKQSPIYNTNQNNENLNFKNFVGVRKPTFYYEIEPFTNDLKHKNRQNYYKFELNYCKPKNRKETEIAPYSTEDMLLGSSNNYRNKQKDDSYEAINEDLESESPTHYKTLPSISYTTALNGNINEVTNEDKTQLNVVDNPEFSSHYSITNGADSQTPAVKYLNQNAYLNTNYFRKIKYNTCPTGVYYSDSYPQSVHNQDLNSNYYLNSVFKPNTNSYSNPYTNSFAYLQNVYIPEIKTCSYPKNLDVITETSVVNKKEAFPSFDSKTITPKKTTTPRFCAANYNIIANCKELYNDANKPVPQSDYPSSPIKEQQVNYKSHNFFMDNVKSRVDTKNIRDSIKEYINSREDVKNDLFNSKEITIPLGDIGEAKYCPNIDDPYSFTLTTSDPNIIIKGWNTTLKIAEIKIVLKTDEVGAMNFIPVVKNNIQYDPYTVQDIVTRVVRNLYGEPIVIRGVYSTNKPYAMIYDENRIKLDNDKFLIVWPTYCNCGSAKPGYTCGWNGMTSLKR